MAKARIRENVRTGWFGYLGQRRVKAFGGGSAAGRVAAAWLAEHARPEPVKRGYSREFKPRGASGKRYTLDRIPAGLWSAVQERCTRDGVSVRAQVLTLLTQWIEGTN